MNLETKNAFSQEKIITNEYLKIKNDLLSGILSIHDFRGKLLELDQSDCSRVRSINNLEILKDREVINFIFSKNDKETEDSYKKFLSFTEFHVGQIKLMDKNIEGLDHVKKALDLAEEAGDDDRWINYLKGTCLYLNNQKIPTDIIDGVDLGNNHKILEAFNAGLKERGHPDYFLDYYAKSYNFK